jgi:hypothetical protein
VTVLTRRRFLTGAGTVIAAAAVGCHPRVGGAIGLTTRAELPRRWFDAPFGRYVCGDIPRAYPVDDNTTLWITNDTFLANRAGTGPHDRKGFSGTTLVRNAAFTERGGQLGLIHDPTREFLPHEGNHLDQWWWCADPVWWVQVL